MKVGDYVRTIKGNIYKLTENDLKFEITKQNCKISSPNIIGLIEVGDYVNGHLVLNVLDFNDNTRILSLEKIYDSNIVEEDIKSIVTKEQFESMKYKVGE